MSEFLGKPITEWTIQEANRRMCGDYLRALAKLVETGALEAFDIGWNPERRKPEGKMVMGAGWITAPVETEFLDALQKHITEQETKIQVYDATTELANHQPCTGEAKDKCALCNTKLS